MNNDPNNNFNNIPPQPGAQPSGPPQSFPQQDIMINQPQQQMPGQQPMPGQPMPEQPIPMQNQPTPDQFQSMPEQPALGPEQPIPMQNQAMPTQGQPIPGQQPMQGQPMPGPGQPMPMPGQPMPGQINNQMPQQPQQQQNNNKTLKIVLIAAAIVAAIAIVIVIIILAVSGQKSQNGGGNTPVPDTSEVTGQTTDFRGISFQNVSGYTYQNITTSAGMHSLQIKNNSYQFMMSSVRRLTGSLTWEDLVQETQTSSKNGTVSTVKNVNGIDIILLSFDISGVTLHGAVAKTPDNKSVVAVNIFPANFDINSTAARAEELKIDNVDNALNDLAKVMSYSSTSDNASTYSAPNEDSENQNLNSIFNQVQTN